jgi:hypothetical protein
MPAPLLVTFVAGVAGDRRIERVEEGLDYPKRLSRRRPWGR